MNNTQHQIAPAQNLCISLWFLFPFLLIFLQMAQFSCKFYLFKSLRIKPFSHPSLKVLIISHQIPNSPVGLPHSLCLSSPFCFYFFSFYSPANLILFIQVVLWILSLYPIKFFSFLKFNVLCSQKPRDIDDLLQELKTEIWLCDTSLHLPPLLVESFSKSLRWLLAA